MRLFNIQVGKKVRVIKLYGGRGLEQKMWEIGIVPGIEAQVVRHGPMGGPILLYIDGREIALGRRIASKIEVEEI